MHRLVILLIVILISLFPFKVISSPDVIHDLKVHIFDSESFSINKHIFGIHGALLWSPLRYGDSVLADAYQNLGFSLIRFPGGTDANYYLWRSADYGCNTNKQIGSVSQDRIKRFNRSLSRKNRTYSTDDFVSFLNQTRSDFSLVVNVLCDTPQSTKEWMENLRDKGITVKYVELGNELHFEEYAWAFPSAEDYVETAQKHVLEVKRVFPEAKIGIVASSSSFRAKNFPSFDLMAKNNRHRMGLAFDKLAAAASFADALVIHIYSTLDPSHRDKILNRLDIGRAYQNGISHFDNRVLLSLHYLHDLNPDKEIWITEWGLAFYDWLRSHETGFVSSYYNALFVMNGLLIFALEPEAAVANYHNITNLWSYAEKLKTNPTYEVIQLLKDPMNQAIKIAPVNLIGGRAYVGTHSEYGNSSPELYAAFFHNDSHGYLIILNKLGNHYRVSSLSSDSNLTLKPDELLQIVPVKSPASSDLRKTQQSLNGNETIDIPPYSITKIIINRKLVSSPGQGAIVSE